MAEVDHAARCAPFNLIADLCDCAVDPGRWKSVLRGTANLIKGCAAAIIAQTPGEDVARIEASWNINSKFERALVETAPYSPTVPAIWLLGIDKTFTTGSLFNESELSNSFWYRRTLQPQGLKDMAVIPLMKSADTFSAVMIMRSADTGMFLPEDTAKLSALSPYFHTAATTSKLLGAVPLARNGSAASFDGSEVGIILTDAAGKILHANAAGERILDGCALLCLEDELAARDSDCHDRLRRAIANAGKTSASAASRVTGPIFVKGAGARSLALWIVRIDKRIQLPISAPPSARVAVIARASGPAAECLSCTEAAARGGPLTASEYRRLAAVDYGAAFAPSKSRPAALQRT
ncbi:MAG: hypothetical protein QM780_03005 [Hyphomicrobium sp.]|uniref:hypothetical protein n=1 Tax=Hyphomicrobium sp. TaxID=82 RepID=UPI0039E445CB